MVQQQYAPAIADMSAYIAQSPAESDTAYYFRGLARNRAERYQDAALADLTTALRGYEKAADSTQADRVTAMIAAVRGGKRLNP